MHRLSVIENEVFKKQVQELLENGIIRLSSSSCGSWRMCMDFRALKKITVKNCYPLQHIDDLLDQLKHANYFTKLDLQSGYHQVRIAEGDIWKTTFKTKQGLFECLVIILGFAVHQLHS